MRTANKLPHSRLLPRALTSHLSKKQRLSLRLRLRKMHRIVRSIHARSVEMCTHLMNQMMRCLQIWFSQLSILAQLSPLKILTKIMSKSRSFTILTRNNRIRAQKHSRVPSLVLLFQASQLRPNSGTIIHRRMQ